MTRCNRTTKPIATTSRRTREPANPRTRGRGSQRWNRLAGTGSRELLGEHLEQGGDDLGVELAAAARLVAVDVTVQAEGEVELIDTLEFGAVLIDAHGQQHPAVYEDVALGPRLLDVRLRAG